MFVCPHCGTSLVMEWAYGELHWYCPNRNDGKHWEVRIVTSDNTRDPEPPR